jgi:hypothetical protein
LDLSTNRGAAMAARGPMSAPVALVVDDEPVVLRLMGRALLDAG